jgi:predicted enzyme related to lactoylglutathione lyase
MQAFYGTCFEMAAVDVAAGYCVLESESMVLSLVVVPDRVAATIPISTPPRRREDVPVKLAFGVDSIEDIRLLAAHMGGLVDPRASEWEFRGSRHCDGVDPEGNVIQMVAPVTTQKPRARTE